MQAIVNELSERLLDSYATLGGINHVDGKNLPSKRAVALLAHDLLRLLFPGFFEEKLIHSSELRQVTADLVKVAVQKLQTEISKSLEYVGTANGRRGNYKLEAKSHSVELLNTFPRLRELLQTDAEAAFNGDPAALSKEEVILAYPFMEAIAVQRIAHELYLREIPFLPRMLTEWAHSTTGMDLHPGARIGTHFFVDHCTGTVVGETTVIGNHVKMYQGVGLVAKSLSAGQLLRGTKRHPTIEDHVTIYAGATIMGGETVVGEGSTIGANVFLTASVPPQSLVVQEAANLRVLSKRDKDKPRKVPEAAV